MPSHPRVDIAIIEAGVVDAERLAMIHRDLFAPPWTADDFAALLKQSNTLGLIARVSKSKEPVGLLIGRVAADEAEILTLGVSRLWQRLGIAARLVETFVRRAAERGATQVFLEVAADNFAAQQLYLAEGFREVGRRPGYYQRGSAPAADALIMSKTTDR